MQAIKLGSVNKPDGPFPLYFEGCSEIKCHISLHLITEQFSTLPQSILNEIWSRENSSVSGSCSHVASSLHDGALIYLKEGMINCVHWQLFLEVFLSSCSDFHERFISVFNSVLPKSKTSRTSNDELWSCAQRCFQILWIFWLCHVLKMMEYQVFKVSKEWCSYMKDIFFLNCATFVFLVCWTFAHLYLWETQLL